MRADDKDTPTDGPALGASPPQPNLEDRKMAQVRELLFGSVMRAYELRFQTLEERLAAEIERLEGDLRQRMAELVERLEIHVDDLSGKLRQETFARTAELEALGNRNRHELNTQHKELIATVEHIEAEFGQRDAREREALARLQASIDSAFRTMGETLSAEREQMRDEKLGRSDLADMMDELSKRLRGSLGLPEQ